MATLASAALVDDLDGSTGHVTTVPFALDGFQYEIDLNQRNARALRGALGRYIAAGRRTISVRPGDGPRRAPSDDPVRRWACQQGIYVCEHGSVPRAVRAAYEAARTQALASARTRVLPSRLRPPRHEDASELLIAG